MKRWIVDNRVSIIFAVVFLFVLNLENLFISKSKPNESSMYALLIGGGTTDYDNHVSLYKNIEYVACSLKQMGYEKKNIKILFYGGRSSSYPLADGHATKGQVIAELQRYEEIINKKDSLLIFRSGHGIIDLLFDEKAPVAVNAKSSPVKTRKVIGTAAVMKFPDGSLSYLQLSHIFSRIKAKQIVLILSQCYSGQFTEIATHINNVVIVSETDEVGIAFFDKRKSKRWKYEVWPFVKCLFDGFLCNRPVEGKNSLLVAFRYMLLCNPNVEGLSIKADRPILKENPQIKYGKGLVKGAVYINRN